MMISLHNRAAEMFEALYQNEACLTLSAVQHQMMFKETPMLSVDH